MGGDAVGDGLRHGLGLWMCLEGAVCASIYDEIMIVMCPHDFCQLLGIGLDPVEDSIEVAVEYVFRICCDRQF